MKTKFALLTLLLALSQTVQSQRYALFDKTLEKPILFTDSVTVQQVTQGYFPIENKSTDTLAANIQYLKKMVSVRQRSKMESFELKSGNITINVKRVPYAYGDRYEAIMYSSAGEVKSQMTLINSEIKNKRTGQKLERMLDYFEKNKSFFKAPGEVEPKIYNITVISDR